MFRSLRQRLVVLVLIPVALLIAAVGLAGFIYASGKMLEQWQEASLLKLERAAHFIEMRLNRPTERIRVIVTTPGRPNAAALRNWLIRELETMDGVSLVEVELREADGYLFDADPVLAEMIPMEQFNRAFLAEINAIKQDGKAGRDAVSLRINLRDGIGRRFGQVEVTMPLSSLLQDIQQLGWWQSDMVCLVDGQGNYLTHTGAMAPLMAGRKALGETGDELELAVQRAMAKERSGTVLRSGSPLKHVAGFTRVGLTRWAIILFAPGGQVLKPIVQFMGYYSTAGLLCLATILVLIRLLEGQTVKSIKKISEAAQQVAKGNYGEPLPVKGRDEIAQLARSFNAMTEGLKERDKIADTFGRYMDPDVARELMRSPDAVRLGGQKRDVTILMSDIRGFSAVAESLTPEQTITLINRYVSRMIDTIQDHRGIIVDFFGDGILVFFDPLGAELDETVARAARCALAMQRAGEDLNSQNEAWGLPQLHTGIGVHVGSVVVGNVGSEKRAKFGIVGSAVNVTERIQSAAKGGEVLVSEAAHQRIRDPVTVKRTVQRTLKGVEGRMTLYAVAGISSSPVPTA